MRDGTGYIPNVFIPGSGSLLTNRVRIKYKFKLSGIVNTNKSARITATQ